MECWCGLSVKSSQLVGCTIDLRKIGWNVTMKNTQLSDCKILIKGDQKGQSFRDIGNVEGILRHIHNIVERPSDLRNCTLEIS